VLADLHLRGLAVDRRESNEFMGSMFALIMPECDNPKWWADAYVEATSGKAAPPRVVMV
jgi:hypothetical protein